MEEEVYSAAGWQIGELVEGMRRGGNHLLGSGGKVFGCGVRSGRNGGVGEEVPCLREVFVDLFNQLGFRFRALSEALGQSSAGMENIPW